MEEGYDAWTKFNLHQMYHGKRGRYIYSMRIDSAERFTYSFMFSNTQFCTISLPIITFRMKKVNSLFLVRLHWGIQNSSCTLNMPMFKLNSSSLTDSLLGNGNYHVNLSLGPGVNPLSYEDTGVNFPTIPRGSGDRGCTWLVHNPPGKLTEGYFYFPVF